jgi:hypothetical protein
MSSFTPEQKAFIRQVVEEAAPHIIDRHVQTCPWGRKISRMLWIGVGIGITCTILGIGTAREFLAMIQR